MKFLATRTLLLAALLASLGFALLANVVPTSSLINVLNGVFMGVMAAVLVIWVPGLYRALRQRRFGRVSQLVVGISLIWVAMGLQRGFSVFFRSVGQPNWLSNSPWLALIIYIAVIGGILHIIAPSTSDDGALPTQERWTLGIAFAAALVVGVASIIMQS